MTFDPRSAPPHRRQHWAVDDQPDIEPPLAVELQSPADTRREAKRLLGRDAAIVLIGIILALLVVEFMPGIGPGPAADETAGAPGVVGGSSPPGASAPPGFTFGPVVDPGLPIDRTPRPKPAITLPPTGTFDPGATEEPTPRPSRKPPATIAPPTEPPAPTPTPTPEPTIEVTPAPDPPVAGFEWSPTLLVVDFVDTSSGEATAWDWDFGDGTSSTDRNPSHVYLAPGEYQVRLRVTGPGGSDSIERTVTVSLD